MYFPQTHAYLGHHFGERRGDLGVAQVRDALDLGAFEGLQQLDRAIAAHVRRRHGLAAGCDARSRRENISG